MANFLQAIKNFLSYPTHSRTLSILSVLTILLAIPLTVFIAQQQQEIRQRAAGNCQTVCDGPPTCREGGQICEPTCRSCTGEHANDPGCDGDPNHPDVCDGPPNCQPGPTVCDGQPTCRQVCEKPTVTPQLSENCQTGTFGASCDTCQNWFPDGGGGDTGWVDGPSVQVRCPSQRLENVGTYCTRSDGKKKFSGSSRCVQESAAAPTNPPAGGGAPAAPTAIPPPAGGPNPTSGPAAPLQSCSAEGYNGFCANASGQFPPNQQVSCGAQNFTRASSGDSRCTNKNYPSCYICPLSDVPKPTSPPIKPQPTATPTPTPRSGQPTATTAPAPPGAGPTATPPPAGGPTGTRIAGDIDGDGHVNIQDYTILTSCYGSNINKPSCGTNKTKADLNNDGKIDGIDYNILIRNFGR